MSKKKSKSGVSLSYTSIPKRENEDSAIFADRVKVFNDPLRKLAELNVLSEEELQEIFNLQQPIRKYRRGSIEEKGLVRKVYSKVKSLIERLERIGLEDLMVKRQLRLLRKSLRELEIDMGDFW